MPRQYDIFGIDDAGVFLKNNLADFIQNGQSIYSGYKHIIIVYKNGNYEVDCTLEETKENIVFQTINMHIANNTVWTLAPQMVYNRDYSDWLSCMCTVNGIENMTPVCIINPDILPRIGKGETFQARVIAFSINLNTFATVEEMEDTFPVMSGMQRKPELENAIPDLNGKKIRIAQGVLMPIGFLSNHQVPIDGSGEPKRKGYDYSDDVSLICGEIIRLRPLNKGNEQDISCRIITINTEYGELDICVADNEQDYSVGRYILGSIILSADVRVHEYENGAIFDEKHLLKLLLEALESVDFSRFENVLADDCRLLQENVSAITGKQNVINFLENAVKNDVAFYSDMNYNIDNTLLSIFSESKAKCSISFKIVLSDKKIIEIAIDSHIE